MRHHELEHLPGVMRMRVGHASKRQSIICSTPCGINGIFTRSIFYSKESCMQVPQWVKPGFWGVVIGAIGMMIISFSWLGWTLGSTAETLNRTG